MADDQNDPDVRLPEPGDPNYESKVRSWRRLIQEGIDSASQGPLVEAGAVIAQLRAELRQDDAAPEAGVRTKRRTQR